MRASLRSLARFVLSISLASACSTGTPPASGDDAPGTGGSSTSGASGGAGKGALGGSGGAGAAGYVGSTATGGTGGSTGGTGGSTGGGAGSSASGSGGSGGAGTAGTGPAGASNGGTGGTTGGSAGTTAGGGLGGAAGTNAGAGAGGAPGSGGMAGASGAGHGAWPACSPDALFCSGFEDAGLPAGATYLSSNDNNDPTKGLTFDKTVFHGGAGSVEILKIASYAQRELVVPAAPTFWFRAYLRTDVAIGGSGGSMHNLFFEAAWAGADKGVEIVEEDCELGMNISDTRYGSNGTTNQPGCPSAAPLGTQLAENAWHCMEGYFDGTKGDFRVFADNQEVITQTGVAAAKQQFNALRFGYREYHERQRLVWYDDVVTGPTRIGCQ